MARPEKPRARGRGRASTGTGTGTRPNRAEAGPAPCRFAVSSKRTEPGTCGLGSRSQAALEAA
jgi:hypothetical protein